MDPAIALGAFVLIFAALALVSLRWGAPIAGSPGSKEEEPARSGLSWNGLTTLRRGALRPVEQDRARKSDLPDVA